jgi:predicted lipoprotein with Yx(FWY)xxD motif
VEDESLHDPEGGTIMSKPGFPVSARRVTGLVSVAAALTLAAACSSGTSSSSGSSKSSGSSGSSGSTVSSGTATVNGAKTTVLTAPDGHTLYYFTPDTAGGQPTCTGGCAAVWPPLVSTSPTEVSGVTGKLTVATGGNTNQVIYNGHPLYEYKPDTAAGQASGEGVMGKWHAATPGLAAGDTMAPAPSSPSSGGSGGYGGSGGGY